MTMVVVHIAKLTTNISLDHIVAYIITFDFKDYGGISYR
jgi:hypothetical protein